MAAILHINHSFKTIKDYLRKAKIFCFATDTVYALSCDATILEAVKRIYTLKKRSLDKPVPILVRDIYHAQKYAILNEYAIKLINKFSPGPMTYILKAIPDTNIASPISHNKNIGIRIPAHSVASIILKNYPHPLVGTSANSSRGKATRNIRDIFESELPLDIVITDALDSNMDGVESTIIDLTVEGRYHIVRNGKITQEEIEEAINQ
jgi:tRNA threonylcarbamoyl adenosine modification protein (Sua5/YciO/YrdC/YwlC family)